MQPYATVDVSLGSAEETYDTDMTHSYRLTEGRLIRYPVSHVDSSMIFFQRGSVDEQRGTHIDH